MMITRLGVGSPVNVGVRRAADHPARFTARITFARRSDQAKLNVDIRPLSATAISVAAALVDQGVRELEGIVSADVCVAHGRHRAGAVAQATGVGHPPSAEEIRARDISSGPPGQGCRARNRQRGRAALSHGRATIWGRSNSVGAECLERARAGRSKGRHE